MPTLRIRGLELHKSYMDPDAQKALVDQLREVMRLAPPFSPQTRFGKPMSVAMTSAGRFGWYADRSGYRYVDRHPDGCAWPPIPDRAMAIWRELADGARLPECCLVNYYGEGARMGMHQDRDEADFSMPVISVSLGDSALFRIGDTRKGGKTESVWLESGDVVVMGGQARMTYHGVDRIRFGSSSLLPRGGRINLTMRVVT